MKDWLSTTIILCTFGFFREFRPSDRSGYLRITIPDKNLSEGEVEELEESEINSHLSHTVFMLLITDYLLYQPILVLSAVVGVILWTMVVTATSSEAKEAIQVLHGIYVSAEVAYFTYIYAKVEKEYFFDVSVLTRSVGLFSSAISSALAEILVNTGSWTELKLNYISLGAQFASLLVAVILPRAYQPSSYDKAVAEAATNATEDAAEAVADAAVEATEAATQNAVDEAIQAAAEAVANIATGTVRDISLIKHQRNTMENETDNTEFEIEESGPFTGESANTQAHQPKMRTVGAQTRKQYSPIAIHVEYIRRRITEALDVDEITADICRRALQKLNKGGIEVNSLHKRGITQLQLAKGSAEKNQEIAGTVSTENTEIADGIRNKAEVKPESFENQTGETTEGLEEKAEKVARSSPDMAREASSELKEKISDKIQEEVEKATEKDKDVSLLSFKGIKQRVMFLVTTYSNWFILKWSLWWILANSIFLMVSDSSQILWHDIDPDRHKVSKGTVKAVAETLSAAASISVIFTRHRRFPRWFEVWILAAASVVESVLIFTMSITTHLWLSYSAYILFGVVYNFLITYASGLISKELVDQTYGMIFGINTFASLSVTSAVTAIGISEDGFNLKSRTRFYLFSALFIIIAGVYGIGGFMKQPHLRYKLKQLKIKFKGLISKMRALCRIKNTNHSIRIKD
ncbi:folate transporter 1-like isoform X2 [Hermetia illucens]|uniref:folate transporter 1-like isoform X2 n=1 Tax=Hermetia illucens TaxID=343691 RepID=UPI0018CBF8F8|nr:folate transporter 1-like isoform X2 [Hermetia illucens]